jgi:hypothetical protein
MAMESNDDDRLFVRDGWRHYRRRYSLGEFRSGLVTFGAIVLIAGWVMWKGKRPDPALYSDGAGLLSAAGTSAGPTTIVVSPPQISPASSEGSSRLPEPSSQAASDRGPLPRDLVGAGWKEEKVAQFDEENLYVKINGRADYFRAFNFRRLYSVTFVNEKDAAVSIDVEMYDLGNPANALGAYGGERAPDARVVVTPAGLHHFSRNALLVARGPYYVRVIGSDETPLITETLKKVADNLIATIKSEPLPWAYGLFLGEMNLSADKITYSAKNAFSLAFADDVWTVRPKGKEDDLEVFVSARQDDASARRMAGRYQAAFLEGGQAAGKMGGVALVKDQFLGLISGATSVDKFVIGVRGAADKAGALEEIERLRAAIKGAPAELRALARPQAAQESVPQGTATPASTPEAVDEK